MEEKKLLTTEEIKEERRKKGLATLKASNELLEHAKRNVMETDKIDNLTRTERVAEIEMAIQQNKMKAQTLYHATEEEVENSVYNEVSDEYKQKYEEQLKKKGLTENEINRIDAATVTTSKNEKATSKRKHVVKRKKKDETSMVEDLVRVTNEEELMHKSMATDKDIVERIKNETKQEDKLIKTITESLEIQKIKPSINKPVVIENSTSNRTPYTEDNLYDFIKTIDSCIQYDTIPLPSNGRCYPIDSPLRCGKVAVAFLTASDENLISSPNMYRDSTLLINNILRNKILDPNIDITNLCNGDRDAILLWLRATAYDGGFPIIATNPKNGKKYDIDVDLSQFKYKPFNLKSDENGDFEFKLEGRGDVIKFNFFTKKMEEELKEKILSENTDVNRLNINKYLNDILECLNGINDINKDDLSDINGCIDDIKNILYEEKPSDIDLSKAYNNGVTDSMITHTKSINGITDREYIRKYIENMRSKDAIKYRTYVNDNTPGVDFEMTINIPESDGGGSFKTFLKLSDTLFINL